MIMIKRAFFVLLSALAMACSLWAYSLEELYELCQKRDPEIAQARSAFQQSLLDLKDAKAGYGPKVDLTISASLIANPIDPIVVSTDTLLSSMGLGAQNPGAGDGYVTLYKGQEPSYCQVKLDIAQPLYTWGKLGNAVKLYETITEIRSLQVDDLLSRKQAEIKTRCLAVACLKKMKACLESQIQDAGALVEASRQAAQAGLSLELDALEAEVTASELDVGLCEIERNIQSQLDGISILAGAAVKVEDIELELDLQAMTAVLDMDPEALQSSALGMDRAGLKMLGKLEQASRLGSEIAKASVNWKPDLALVASMDYSGSRLPLVQKDWHGQDDWGLTLTVAVKTTAWDGGKASREVQRALLKDSDAELDIQKARSSIKEALSEALGTMRLARSRMAFRQAKIEVCQAELDNAQSLLDCGYGSDIDLIKARLALQQQELELIKAELELATAYCTVELLSL